MNHRGLSAQQDRRARRLQASRVRLALVTQGVVLCGDDQRRRKPAQVRLEQGAYGRVRAPTRIGHPELNPPGDVVDADSPARRFLPRARPGQRQVSIRVDEHLGIGQRRLLVAEPQAGKGRQVTAGAVADDQQGALAVPGQFRTAGRRPQDRRHGIVRRRGRRVLGRPPVVNGENRRPGRQGHAPAQPVVRVEAADGPHPAVQKNREGDSAPGGRTVKPPVHAAGYPQIGNAGHRRAGRPRGNPHPLKLANRNRAQLGPRRPGRCPIRRYELDESCVRQHVTPVIRHRPSLPDAGRRERARDRPSRCPDGRAVSPVDPPGLFE